MAKIENDLKLGLVVFAKNINRVSVFYQRTLNLDVINKEPSYHVLQRADLEVVIHSIPKKIAATIDISTPPAVRERNPLKPAFVVDDLEGVRVAANAAGGFLKPASAVWAIRSALVLDGWDPEGNVVQFKQRAK